MMSSLNNLQYQNTSKWRCPIRHLELIRHRKAPGDGIVARNPTFRIFDSSKCRFSSALRMSISSACARLREYDYLFKSRSKPPFDGIMRCYYGFATPIPESLFTAD